MEREMSQSLSLELNNEKLVLNLKNLGDMVRYIRTLLAKDCTSSESQAIPMLRTFFNAAAHKIHTLQCTFPLVDLLHW
jgi:hypothetical protein